MNKTRNKKLLVMTGGGTMGHVTPNLALVPGLRKCGYDIYYIGSRNGMERQKIESLGIPYYPISTGKLRRYLDVKNFTDLFRIVKGYANALSIIRKLKPDIVFSKGGFVSCPVVWAARSKRIPVVIHESDITPGLANRLSIPFASRVCYSFPETGKHIPKNKGVMTGIPIRHELFSGIAQKGIEICGFTKSKPVIMVIGGSLGSASVNSIVRNCLNDLLKKFQVCHICGKGNVDDKLSGMKGYKQFEYVDKELPHLFAMSDIVVSRAGATTLFEIAALGKPNILIPLSSGASRGDQLLNAESFRMQGLSYVLKEGSFDSGAFINAVNEVYSKRDSYIQKMSERNSTDAIARIIEILQELTN